MKLSYYEYVKNYYINNFSGYLQELSEKEYSELILSVTTAVEGKIKNINQLKEHKADEFISQKIIKFYLSKKTSLFRADYTNLTNYIKKYLNSKYLLNCSDKTIDYLTKRISITLIPNFNYNDLNNGLYDRKIDIAYNKTMQHIMEYIISYISQNIIPLTDIDQVSVAKDITKLIFNSYEYNIPDLLEGKYKQLIEHKTTLNRNFNNTNRINNVYNYIKNVIKNRLVEKQKLDEITKKIYDELLNKGYKSTDITSGKIDKEIIEEFNNHNIYVFRPIFEENNMRNQSVVREDKLKKIKAKRRKQKINQTIISLLIAGTLISGASIGIKHIENDIQQREAENIVCEWVGYKYPNINTIYTDSFSKTIDNIIDKYDEYSSFDNNNYKYLGFYQAYRSVKQDRLYIMDKMLTQVRSDQSTNGKILKQELSTTSCYLEFMYKRICDMGYTKIDKDDFYDLLEDYLSYKREHPEIKDVVNHLTNKQQRLVEKIKDTYIELSEQYLLELSVQIKNNKNETTGKGR